MVMSIFLTIGMYIGQTRLLEVGFSNAKYNLESKLCKEYIIADYNNDDEIKKAIIADNNKDDDEEDF